MHTRLNTSRDYPNFYFGPFETSGKWCFQDQDHNVWYITDASSVPSVFQDDQRKAIIIQAARDEASEVSKDQQFWLDAIGRGHFYFSYNYWRNTLNHNREFDSSEQHHKEFHDFCLNDMVPQFMLWSTVEGRDYYAFTFVMKPYASRQSDVLDLGSNEVPFDPDAPKEITGTVLKSGIQL